MDSLPTRVRINDTTLRDGEQSPGVCFTTQEKLEIARRLDSLGVDQIEAGTPAMGEDEQAAIRAIASAGLKADVSAWCRALESDIEAALDCGVRNLHISLPVSWIQIIYKLRKNPDWVLYRLQEVMKYARSRVDYLSVGAEDASRADIEFLFDYATIASNNGADRFRYCDTVGMLDPFSTYETISVLEEAVDIPLEIHAHNDFGMATANTLAAARAGATWVSTTVNGLGERAGNAPLEEVIMGLKHVEEAELKVKTDELLDLCQFVAAASNRPIPPWKAISGAEIFSHESGIHADGVIKNPINYEPFNPDEIGHQRLLPLGKHSGSHSLIHHLDGIGIYLSETEAKRILPELRRFTVENKRPPTETELKDMCTALTLETTIS